MLAQDVILFLPTPEGLHMLAKIPKEILLPWRGNKDINIRQHYLFKEDALLPT